MTLTHAQYNHIMRNYEDKQLRSRDQLDERFEQVYKEVPEIKSIEDSISTLSLEKAKRLLNGDEKALTSLKEELQILIQRKHDLLTHHKISSDYLSLQYECNDCQDTGYIGNQKCHCFKQSIIELLYTQSNLQTILEKENFNTFDLSFYSKRRIDPKTGRSSLETIEKALDTCRNFVDTFCTEHRNLFLYGDTGIGKTFLSHCIAKELIDQSHSVIYFSAFELFDTLAKSKFEKDLEAKDMNQYIFDCDLLIIDDLGTELTNSFVISQFFLCINERLSRGKSTIISTNLSLDALADIYNERSFSRITSNYTMLKLTGDDIRIKKKLKNMED